MVQADDYSATRDSSRVCPTRLFCALIVAHQRQQYFGIQVVTNLHVSMQCSVAEISTRLSRLIHVVETHSPSCSERSLRESFVCLIRELTSNGQNHCEKHSQMTHGTASSTTTQQLSRLSLEDTRFLITPPHYHETPSGAPGEMAGMLHRAFR